MRTTSCGNEMHIKACHFFAFGQTSFVNSVALAQVPEVFYVY